MNTLSKLSLLACAFISVTACNEKVSSELQNASSSTTSGSGGGGSTVVPDEYYFRVVNKADTMLNFKLHKTGAGNANTPCEVSQTTALSNDLYRASPATYDITCYLEAEELALSHNGLQFAYEASPNTCTYVGYAPFSYYNYQPGDSTQTINKAVCNNGITYADLDAAAGGALDNTGACDTYRSTTAGSANFVTESVADLCNFDYGTKGSMDPDAPNCDEGVITVNTYTGTLLDLDGDGTATDPDVEMTTQTVRCGGKAINCIEGAIKHEASLAGKYTNGVVTSLGSSSEAFSREIELPSLYGKYPTNRKYVNFRRDLAATEIDYGNSDRSQNDDDPDNDGTLAGSYQAAFATSDDFDPMLMMNYSLNRMMDPSIPLVTTAMKSAVAFEFLSSVELGVAASAGEPLAADPFMGLKSGYRTNPFYTFYCFDNAYDIRARIKMVVRDWDRVLPVSSTSTYFERISDIDQLPPIARQDVPYTDEVSGDADSWNAFNDIEDWDDLMDMERDDLGIPYDPSVTVWRPMPAGNFSDGFMNTYIFPMENPN